ncbi:MAG: energy-coupling factor transporter transmembrane protein EcfT [Sneathiella sp.]
MLSLYHSADTVLHRLPAGVKLTCLAVLGTFLFIIETIDIVGGAFILIAALYGAGKIPFRMMIGQVKPVFWLLLIIFLAQGFLTNWPTALLIVLRFLTLILAASLVTLTTRTSDMVVALETGLRHLSRWISVEKVSLALSLSIRFIPVIGSVTKEVREAQRARGLDRSFFAVAMPVIIRTLKMGTQIAEALDARSFDTEK